MTATTAIIETRQTVIAVAVDAIAARHGGVCQPGALVDAAKSVKHPCHIMFEWDDTAAGAAWRVEQARRIIRSVRIERAPDERTAPAYVHVRQATNGMGGYMSTPAVLAAPDLRRQVLADAVAQLRGLQARFDTLAELGPVWAALDAVD